MKKGPSAIITCIMLFIILTAGTVAAQPANDVNDAIEVIANRLIARQEPNGVWLGEEDFTGSIGAGLVCAYEVTGQLAYRDAAKLSGNFIIDYAEGNFLGDEAYALSRLTEITGNATYADAVEDFYNALDTYTYIRFFTDIDPSTAVFYIAEHTVAAHKVGATDAVIWRDALIQFLSQVDDDAAYWPVMGLGVATWALAETGPMDDTRIDPFGFSEDYWKDVKLSDLPGILAGHQVLSGDYAGSFYHRFDHTPAGEGYEASGYTEDTIFGVLGLLAANKADSKLDLWANILLGRTALASGVDADGAVYEHIWSKGALYYTYGGEMLQAFSTIPE
jgi:hypothetical protein